MIPEIDIPGHSEAFKRTFRHDMQSREGKIILKLLFDEICENLDVPYLHIGTDEVSFTDPDFVPEMISHIRTKGKKVISWNPGWTYQPGEIDMTQLWSYRGKAQKGIPAIDSRFHYLNHYDIFGDLVALYNSRIYNCNEGSDDIAGVILAIWNDRLVVPERNIILENNFYPAMLAIADAFGWEAAMNTSMGKVSYCLPIILRHSSTSPTSKNVCYGTKNITSGNILSPMSVKPISGGTLQTHFRMKVTFPGVFPRNRQLQTHYQTQSPDI